jgi:membrane-associated phospholipid phosphatase
MRRVAILGLLALGMAPAAGWAREVPAAPTSARAPVPTVAPAVAFPDSASTAPVKLFQWRFVGEVALGTAASLALVPADGRVRTWMQDPARQGSAALDHAASVLTPFGSTVPFVAAAALYGVGLVAHAPTAADVGLHVGEAMAGAGVTTLFLKILVGRRRPYVEPHDPHAFGQGPLLDVNDELESFPSGHATVAFALAGSLTEEAAQHWPGSQRVVAPITFATATGVAFARMYRDKHWASDVLAGAVVGTLVSRRVVRALHTGGAGPFSRLEPFLLPGRGGETTAGLSVTFR